MEEFPYCFWMSFVKFRGQTDWKIDLDHILVYKVGRKQIPRICLVNKMLRA